MVQAAELGQRMCCTACCRARLLCPGQTGLLRVGTTNAHITWLQSVLAAQLCSITQPAGTQGLRYASCARAGAAPAASNLRAFY
jgi:hypothetical protein